MLILSIYTDNQNIKGGNMSKYTQGYTPNHHRSAEPNLRDGVGWIIIGAVLALCGQIITHYAFVEV